MEELTLEKWIKVQSEETESNILIKVIDCGEEIHIEDIEKIFDPFYTSKDPGKGTGLGLSLCRHLMERNRGRIYLDKKNPHTCFILEFKKD